MKGTYYRFKDGYFCWVAGRLTAADKKRRIQLHGEIVEQRTI